MEQITIHLRDKKKAGALLKFLKTLDYIENIVMSDYPSTDHAATDENDAFYDLAGIWKGRDISQDSLRQQAWPKRT
ncbi:MAG: hypothetical protein WCP19_06870 [Chloroflexota bacterium]